GRPGGGGGRGERAPARSARCRAPLPPPHRRRGGPGRVGRPSGARDCTLSAAPVPRRAGQVASASTKGGKTMRTSTSRLTVLALALACALAPLLTSSAASVAGAA